MVVVGFFVFVLVPVLWWCFAWQITGTAGRNRWETRAILAVMAVAAMVAIVSFLMSLIFSPEGTWETVVPVVSYVALFIEMSPFVASLIFNRRARSGQRQGS
jgi:hypothetical protein